MLDLVVQSGQFWIQRFLSHLSCVAWCPLSAIPSACLQASSATCHIRGIRFGPHTCAGCAGCVSGASASGDSGWLAGWLAGWRACSVLVVLVVFRAHRPQMPRSHPPRVPLVRLLVGMLVGSGFATRPSRSSMKAFTNWWWYK